MSGIVVFQISKYGHTDRIGLSTNTEYPSYLTPRHVNLNPTILIPVLFIILTFMFAHIGLKPYEVTVISGKRGNGDDIAAPILTILTLAGLYACFVWGLYQQKEWYSPTVAYYFSRIAPFVVPVIYFARWKEIREAPKTRIPRDFEDTLGARRHNGITRTEFGNPPNGGGSRGKSRPAGKRRRAA